MSAAGYQWLTPPAPAAIAVVRCRADAACLARLIDRALPGVDRARFAHLRAVDGALVDEVVAVRTAERTCELMTHGGPGMRAAIDGCLAGHGLAQADDASHAPAASSDARWSALAAAASPAAVAWLLAHDGGTPPFPAAFLARCPVVLISGPPNAGKSTLLNAWCGHQRALVSDLPGTTRDLIAAETLAGGWRLRLLDSAGLRATGDRLEAAGQDLVRQARGWADLVLTLRPAGDASPATGEAGDLVVLGKADLEEVPGSWTGPRWSALGVAGGTPAALLADLEAAVLARLGLPALAQGTGAGEGAPPGRLPLPGWP